MYDKVRALAEANGIVKFFMNGEEAAFREGADGDWSFTVGGEDDVICYAQDLDAAIDCLKDECDEDQVEIIE